jgi:tetratricopeptide (TPR) repeat protein
LPDWVFVAAIVMVVVGLPITMATALVERQRATGRIPTPSSDSGSVIRRWLIWRNAMRGGVVALVALAAVTVAYMAMRSLGIGPVGTLMATGVLEERGGIIVADFENRTTDSTLGASITELLRIDLGQSPTVRLTETSSIADALRLMERDPGTRLDLELAREVAEREGVKAIVAGEVAPLGTGYVLSARVVSSADGETLVAVRETVENEGEIIRAVEGLSAKLRERIGESLRTIRSSEPLARVSTASLEALRLYTHALRAELAGNETRAIGLMQEAVGVDTSFAMAYRKLATIQNTTGAEASKVAHAARKAFQYRDRLPPVQRYFATAAYYLYAELDLERRISAYQSALDVEPENGVALNNLGVALIDARRFGEAEGVLLRAQEVGGYWQPFIVGARAQVAQGQFEAAMASLERLAERQPGHPRYLNGRAKLAVAQNDLEGATTYLDSLAHTQSASLYWQWEVSNARGDIARLRGKLAEAERHIRNYMRLSRDRELPGSYILGAANIAWLDIRHRNVAAEALGNVDAALERYPVDSLVSASILPSWGRTRAGPTSPGTG